MVHLLNVQASKAKETMKELSWSSYGQSSFKKLVYGPPKATMLFDANDLVAQKMIGIYMMAANR